MLISSYKIPRGIMVAYTTLFLEISFVRTKARPVFGTFTFILRLFVTSAQCASSSVFGVTLQESSLVPERCFLDILQCCYNSSLVYLSLYAGGQAMVSSYF